MPGTDVVRAVERSGQMSSQFIARQLAQLSINNAEAHVLMHLRPDTPSSITEIQRLFPRRSSTMTSVLDRLEHKGLLTRQVNPEDRRTFQLRLTTEGQRVAKRVTKVMTDLEAAIRAQVSETDLAGFSAVSKAVDTATQ